MQSASSARLRLRTSVSGSDALSEHAALLARVEELLPRVDDVAQRLISCFGAGGRVYTFGNGGGADDLALVLVPCFGAGGRVYTFGNGGSSPDAAHFAEERLGRFKRERRPLP